MTRDEVSAPEIQELLETMEKICHDLAWGRYERADRLFEMTGENAYPEQITRLAESFGLMLVKVEAREFRMEQVMSELKKTAKKLELSRKQLLKDNAGLKKGLMKSFSSRRILGKNPEVLEVLDQVKRIADTSVNVVITGETGTGKELIAKALHYNSFRRTGPFLAVNCSAIPEGLFESEFFGIEKGVATGVSRRAGIFEQAAGGTLLLDEITELPMTCQGKILRVLEERELTRVGGSRLIPVDVRVLAATNKDLEEEVRSGRLREDLYFRLNVVNLSLPPLRRRTEDIPLLLKSFVEVDCLQNNRKPPRISKQAMDVLLRYPWPGNVRQLKNEVERLVALYSSGEIRPEDLSSEIAGHDHLVRDTLPGPVAGSNDESLEADGGLGPDVFAQSPDNELESERKIIQRALMSTRGNKTRAAEILGISREGLRKKMKRLLVQ